MKPALDLHRVAGRPVAILAASVGLSLALPLLCGGCKKDGASTTGASAPAPAAAPTSGTPTALVVPSASAPAAVTNAAPDLRAQNRALIMWIVHNRRHPATFEEFAASAGVPIPAPPPGKKYIIDRNGLISLVNR